MTPQPVPSEEARYEGGFAAPRPAGERWRHAFSLVSAYWMSKEWKFAWGAIAVLLAFEMGGVYLIVWENGWQRQFFDTIEQRQVSLFMPLLAIFVLILGLQIGQSMIVNFLDQTIGLRWRLFLTQRYMNRWLARNRYYEIERLRLVDNPDQRIAEDIQLFTRGTLRIGISLISATVGAISFIVILLRTSEPLRLSLFGYTIAIPGDIVWFAVAYVLCGTALITYIGRPLIRRTMRQQHYEADFRANLIHVRRNAAQIGFADSIDVESRSLIANLANVGRNYQRLILSQLGLTAGQGIYDRIGTLIPLFVTIPRFFAGKLSFGQVMSSRDAFTTLVGELSYFLKIYPSIAAQIANLNRIKALDDAIDHCRPRGIGFTADAADAGIAITAQNLSLVRPHGAPLLEVGNWTVATGERWVVQGPSGTGKSTLLRAIIGLWPDGSGEIAMANLGTAMFVPQRLYLPLGTLKDAICFPDVPEMHDDAVVLALLEKARLGLHGEYLHAVRMWQEDLSPGEQQRLALARILLHCPDLLILDEATSALDQDNATYFYETLIEALPNVTLISVVHDTQMRRYHTHALTIADGHAACAAIVENAA